MQAKILLSILLLLPGMAAVASSGQATDNAFAALFSLPGAGANPNQGSWNTPMPAGFTATTETGLITYLEQQQRLGADFNAYRHFGSLLHHAIRANKLQLATWLLAHGADPHQTLKNGTEDALQLSVRFARDALVKLLQEEYGMQLPAPIARPPAVKKVDVTTATLEYKDASDYSWVGKWWQDAKYAFYATKSADQPQVVATKIKQWNDIKAKMPEGVYLKFMNEHEGLSGVIAVYGFDPIALEAELSALPHAVVEKHKQAMLQTLAEASGMEVSENQASVRSYVVPAESWRVFWKHVNAPLDYSGLDLLPSQIQPELWPALFKSGYNNHQATTAMGCLLAEINASDFKALWPALLTHFTDMQQAAPEKVLAGWRMVSDNWRSNCRDAGEEQTKNKLLFLTSLNIKTTIYGLNLQAIQLAAADFQAAVQPFMPSAEQIAARKPRIVEAQAQCTFTMNEEWYQALVHRDDIGVQLVEIPKQTTCGLLVQWSSRHYQSGIFDTFTGPDGNPSISAPNPDDNYDVLQFVQGKIKRLASEMGEDYGVPEALYVQDVQTGEYYYLHLGGWFSNWVRALLPSIFKWTQNPDGWTLIHEYQADMRNALAEQCMLFNDQINCRGIPRLNADFLDENKNNIPKEKRAYYGMPLQDFIKLYSAERYQAYMTAIMALDKEKLNALQAVGIPGYWTAEAIIKISTSELPLTEMRRRTAWIFRDREQLVRAIRDGGYKMNVFNALLPWLPREDWGPVLQVLGAQGYKEDLSYHVSQAAEKSPALACDLQRALGLICGETLEVGAE